LLDLKLTSVQGFIIIAILVKRTGWDPGRLVTTCLDSKGLNLLTVAGMTALIIITVNCTHAERRTMLVETFV
jgi:hypothetical protein